MKKIIITLIIILLGIPPLNALNKHSSVSRIRKKNVYIYAPGWDFSRYDSYFNHEGEKCYTCRDECSKPFVLLKESLESLGYSMAQVHTLNNLGSFEYLLCFDAPQAWPQIAQYPKEKLVLFLWEPPIVSPHLHPHSQDYNNKFGKVFSIYDDEVNKFGYIKFYNDAMPHFNFMNNLPSFEERKLCTMLAGNKSSTVPGELYSRRKEFINFCETIYNSGFDFYGPDWSKEYKNYQGFAPSKASLYQHYRFAIVYENSLNIEGYISAEKIFFPFVCGCIPIYLGPQNIAQEIPENCFINGRNFNSAQELYAHLISIDKQTYEEYLAHIKTYLKSESIKKFSCENFVHIVMSNLFKGEYHHEVLT